MHTPRFKADPKGAMEAVYKEWVRTYGSERGQLTFYKPVGCDKCGGSGFKGRCGLHELLIASDRLKKAIQEHARVAEMLAIAVDEGMRTLKQDGMEKCLSGVTHIKEVRAVCIK
jgi:type II secretory ATPase GspE/PulE/Tfp pilus assembly ATPase PilB-like protein